MQTSVNRFSELTQATGSSSRSRSRSRSDGIGSICNSSSSSISTSDSPSTSSSISKIRRERKEKDKTAIKHLHAFLTAAECMSTQLLEAGYQKGGSVLSRNSGPTNAQGKEADGDAGMVQTTKESRMSPLSPYTFSVWDGMDWEGGSSLDHLEHQSMYNRQKTVIFGIDTTTKQIVTPVGVHGGINPRSCTCSISTHRRRNLTVATTRKASTIPKTCMTTLKATDSSVTSIQKEIQMVAGGCRLT